MAGLSMMKVLVAAWGIVTVALVVAIVLKALVGFRESDVLILDTVEAKQAAEQQQIVAKAERMTAWVKALGIASAALIVLAGALFTYNSLTS